MSGMQNKPLELPQWLIDWANAAPIHIIDFVSKKEVDNLNKITDNTKDVKNEN
jgi:hypothetical protein